jgi:uncharacterized protein (DUF2236 family)
MATTFTSAKWLPSLGALDPERLRAAIAGAVIAVFNDGRDGDPMAPFLTPAGDVGLYGPESMTWRVHADLPSMMVGGIAALMLQTLHPLAMAGVDEHSDFRVDPLGRLRRTGAFVAAVIFGAMPLVEQHIAMVRAIHNRVTGTAADGRPYAANDPELLTWVHTVEHACFLLSYQRHSGRPLSAREIDRYLDEVAEVALRLGARWVPRSQEQLESYFRRLRPQLYRGPQARRAFEFLEQGAFDDAATRVVYRLLVRAAKATLPAWARRLAGIELLPLEDALLIGPPIDLLGRILRWGIGEPLPLAAARQRCAQKTKARSHRRPSRGRVAPAVASRAGLDSGRHS